MKYIVRSDDNREFGPVDEETLRKWTEAGRILPHTQVRNTLIKKWNKASDFDFLKPSFALQQVRVEEEKGGIRKFSEHLDIIFGGRKKTQETLTPYATAFKNKYIPDPATLTQRLLSALFDSIIILAYAFVLMVYFSMSLPEKAPVATVMPILPDGTTAAVVEPAANVQAPAAQAAAPAAAPSAATAAPAEAAAKAAPEAVAPAPQPVSPAVTAEVNSAFNKCVCLFVIGVLLYFGISLGIFAQTFGMWFWGIMITRTDLSEVFLGRAYFFTVLMFLLGVLSPMFVFLNPYRRALHDILSGTMVIRIAAKPKA